MKNTVLTGCGKWQFLIAVCNEIDAKSIVREVPLRAGPAQNNKPPLSGRPAEEIGLRGGFIVWLGTAGGLLFI